MCALSMRATVAVSLGSAVDSVVSVSVLLRRRSAATFCVLCFGFALSLCALHFSLCAFAPLRLSLCFAFAFARPPANERRRQLFGSAASIARQHRSWLCPPCSSSRRWWERERERRVASGGGEGGDGCGGGGGRDARGDFQFNAPATLHISRSPHHNGPSSFSDWLCVCSSCFYTLPPFNMLNKGILTLCKRM